MGKSPGKRKLPVVDLPTVSASNAEAFVKCGASHILPQSDRGGKYRDKGTEGHEILGAFINKRVPEATMRGIAAVRKFPLGEILGETLPETRLAETAYAVNVKTRSVRFLGLDIKRQYGKLEKYEVPCSIDVEARHVNKTRWVRDWKFGTHSSWFQVLVQCMAVAYPDDEGKGDAESEVDAGIVYIDAQTSGESYDVERKIVSLQEIDEAADALVAAWDRWQIAADAFVETGKKPATAVGPWCKYCRAYTECPAQWNLVAALLGKTKDIENVIGEYTSEDYGLAWAKLREAKQALERIEEAIKGAAIREPIPLPNGKMLAMIECAGRATVDREAAFQLVKSLGGTPAQFDSVVKRGRPYLTAKEIKK